MRTPDQLAEAFWRRAGSIPPLPRDLEAPVLWGLPVAIVKLPKLRTAAVDTWFRNQGRRHALDGPDRPIRACLFAFRGRGVIFIDAADPGPERRFSLAHEVAHFLADYLEPRARILERVGPAYASILDGERPPRPDERIEGLLAGVTLGVHRHLMDRDPGSAARVAESEGRADRLALQLLAPRALVRRALTAAVGTSGAELVRILVDEFGLPDAVARRYALSFLPRGAAAVPLRAWLGKGVELSPDRRKIRGDREEQLEA